MFAIPSDIARRPPLRETPLGDLWQIDDVDETWLIRALGDADLLTVGIALRQATEVDRAELRAPALWERIDDLVYLATPRPHGMVLAESDERLSWGESLDLWRPLADAVRSAHRQGIIHGQLHPWSIYWDATAQRLCATETSTWVSGELPNTVWWPAELRCAPELRLATPQTDVYQLARVLCWLHLGEAEASKEAPSFEGVPGYAIGALSRALSADPEARPRTIGELVQGLTSSREHRSARELTSEEELGTALFGRVSDVERVEHPTFGSGVKFMLHHPTFGEHGGPTGATATGAFFYEKAGGSIYRSVAPVWEGAELSIIDGRKVSRTDGETFLTAGPETLPVLEPHWPVSVSNVVAAQGCVNRRFVDLRDNGPPNIYLVQGILLHHMLDALAEDATADFDETWDAEAPSLRIMMLAAELDEAAVDRMKATVKQHFVNIAGFARGNRGDEGRVGWTGKNVEVTRYSAKYGLEGRIDLVTEDDRDGLQIIELKSGAVRQSHNDQVQCYQLLWDAVSKRMELPLTGRILYSRDGMMRTTTDDPERARRLLLTRNGIVAAHRGFWDPSVNATPPSFMEIPPACNACGFRKARCREQTEVLGFGSASDPHLATENNGPWAGFDASEVERAWHYWRHMTMLIESEHWEETAELGEVLERGRLEQRISNHRAIAGLELGEVDSSSQRITFVGDVPRIFSSGDNLVAHRGDFEGSHILEGRLVAITPESLTLETRGAPSATSLAEDGWIVDVLPARIGYRSAHRALYRFLEQRSKTKIRSLMKPTGGLPQLAAVDTEGSLNESQSKAVEAACGDTTIALIQGPPGTGKTTVIAHAARALAEAGKRVLVCAQTNTAVDTMLERLVDVGVTGFLRVGRSGRSRGLAAALRNAGVEPEEHFTSDLELNTERLPELRKRLEETSIVGTTTHRAVSHSVFDVLKQRWGAEPFDVAIVDEATQISEPMTLGPFTLATRMVLVGDHRQLPPIVKGEGAHSIMVEGVRPPRPTSVIAPPRPQLDLFSIRSGAAESDSPPSDDESMHLGGLDRSLFERLVAAGVEPILLTEQYRMHRDIMSFSNAMFYEDRLRAHPSVAERGLVTEAFSDRFDEIFSGKAVTFVDVDGEDDGRINLIEAEALVETVVALKKRSPDMSLGIVSPYRAQVRVLRRLVERRLGEASSAVDVDTVERYQGSERDVIVVSLVKTDRPGDFLTDSRRLNVTLTRARRKVILFGSRTCLEKSPLYRALLEQPETNVVPWSQDEQ